MPKFVALLRGINVGGRTKLPMSELRALCERIGWQEVRTYIQSGNVVFEADGGAADLEAELEKVVAERFGFAPPVMVRSPDEWNSYVKANPFVSEAEQEANRVMIGVTKRPPRDDSAAALQARAVAGERVLLAGGALWFHYPAGVGTSKLSPSLIDRLAGSPLTARNVRTLGQIQEMLQ